MNDEAFGKAITKKLNQAQPVIAKALALNSAEEKMRFLHKYVRQNFSWNRFYSYTTNDGLKKVWENQKGTNGDLNLLLIHLLKHANVEVYPVLVSERNHGMVEPTVPMLDQFSTVAAFVVIEGKTYVLDATDDSPADLLPYKYLNTNALLIKDKAAEIVNLNDQTGENGNVINVFATINKDGIVQGTAKIISKGYNKIDRKKAANLDKERFIQEFFSYGKEMKVDSLKIDTHDDSLSMEQSFQFYTAAAETGNLICWTLICLPEFIKILLQGIIVFPGLIMAINNNPSSIKSIFYLKAAKQMACSKIRTLKCLITV